MNRLIAIVSFAIATPAFVNLFCDNKHHLIASAIIALLIALLGFYLEGIIKKYGNNAINKIIYFLTKSAPNYKILDRYMLYECFDGNTYKCTKTCEIKSKGDLDRIESRFCWSADSSMAIIDPKYSDHRIENLRSEGRWTAYTIFFGEKIRKGCIIKTGSVISNLIDHDNKVVPFISSKVCYKTRTLTLTVAFYGNRMPKSAVLEVYSDDLQEYCIENRPLEYDPVTHGYSVTIKYPRRKWKYIISWDYCS